MSHNVPAEVFPPGEFIRDEIEARGWTQSDLAAILGKPLPAVNELIAGKKAVTPDTARALAAAFGTSADLWMSLESAYRLSLSAPSADDVARRAKLYSAVPINNIVKRGWLPASDNTDELERNILKFYDVSSIEETESLCFAARKSTSYDHTTADERAWFRRAVNMAASVSPTAIYDAKTFRAEGLKQLQKLKVSEVEARKIPTVLADFGIGLSVVKCLPKMRVDGAAFWITEKRPAIALSLRYDRIDALWFTLAHEICHILNEDDATIDADLVGKDRKPTEEKPEAEQKADAFASEFLVPKKDIESFILRVRPLYSKAKIIQFANRIGVHPGIVVGQLQHRREIGWSHSREMLVSIKGEVTSAAYTDGWGSLETED